MSNGDRVVLEAVLVTLAFVVAGGISFFVIAQARRREPATWRDMQEQLDAQVRQNRLATERYEAVIARVDYLESEIDELREGRAADREMIQEWIAYARGLARQVKELTGTEPPPEPSIKRRPTIRKSSLAKRLAEQFSAEEIDGLAFDMGLSRDEIPGDTRQERARALVDWASDRGRMTELGQRIDEARPK